MDRPCFLENASLFPGKTKTEPLEIKRHRCPFLGHGLSRWVKPSKPSIKANGYNTVSLSLSPSLCVISDIFIGPANLGENLGVIETDDSDDNLGKSGEKPNLGSVPRQLIATTLSF